mgnify:CR=1 FL=1
MKTYKKTLFGFQEVIQFIFSATQEEKFGSISMFDTSAHGLTGIILGREVIIFTNRGSYKRFDFCKSETTHYKIAGAYLGRGHLICGGSSVFIDNIFELNCSIRICWC